MTGFVSTYADKHWKKQRTKKRAMLILTVIVSLMTIFVICTKQKEEVNGKKIETDFKNRIRF